MWRAIRVGLLGGAVGVLLSVAAQAEEVTFTFVPPTEATFETVALRGSFNGWGETPMLPESDGTWSVTVDLPPGEHEYKYFLNGEWPKDMEIGLEGRPVDPEADGYAPDGYGGQNAVRMVGSPPAATMDREYGYRVDGDEIVFELDLADCEAMMRADGDWLDTGDVSVDGVAVAGEFNDWSTSAWPMDTVGDGVYELRRPRADFGQKTQWLFKFVANGSDWIEPPRGAPNRIPLVDETLSHNLVLYTEEDPALLRQLTLPESQQTDRCRLKPLSHAVGAPMIPMLSNPMVTTDRDAIAAVAGFTVPPTPEEEAAYEDEMENVAPEQAVGRIMELLKRRAASVRVAYAAVYESSARGPETGIYALLYDEPPPDARRAQLERDGPSGFLMFRGRVAVMGWADGEDTSCLEALRAHVEDVLAQ